MQFYYTFLLLFVVLNAYLESSQHVKPPDPLLVIHPNSNLTLGSLAPILPQSEVPQNGVYIQPQNEVFKIVQPQNGVYSSVLPQNEVIPVQIHFINSEFLIKKMQNIISKLNSILTQSVKHFKNIPLFLAHGGKTIIWAIRLIPECLQHVLKMYIWSLAENQRSVRIRCKFVGLFLKQSFFRKHDFSAMVDKLYDIIQKSPICSSFDLGQVFSCKNKFCFREIDESLEMPRIYKYYGGGPSLVFSSDELLPYAYTDLDEKQYKFVRCVKVEGKQAYVSEDKNTVLCAMPVNILAPKLTMRYIKDLATLHQIFIPSKTLVKNAQMLLQNHKCNKCDNYISLFEPYKVQSNAQWQQNWYKKLEPDEKIAHLA